MNEGRRVGIMLKVKESMIEEYKKQHRHVWPEMLSALREHGWHNYTLFMRPDGMLFGYVEVPDTFQAALAGMASEDVNRRWQEMMAPYFEIPEGAAPDQSMIELEEIFHVD